MDDKDIKNFKKILEHAQKIQDFVKEIKTVEEYTNNSLITSTTLFEIL